MDLEDVGLVSIASSWETTLSSRLVSIGWVRLTGSETKRNACWALG